MADRLPKVLDPLDVRITSWMARHGVTFTRVALGVVFLWFGAIKFVPDWSPAADLATRTISRLTAGAVSPELSLPLLAAWEALIGLGLLAGRFLRATLLLLFLQMPGTVLPLFFFPGETFRAFPYAPTLEGQYIVKNLVLVAAAIVVGATVRGGQLSARPLRSGRDATALAALRRSADDDRPVSG
jgi:uncharacterized membrane protein YkgB